MSDDPVLAWKKCGAPAGGCGAGQRRGFWTDRSHCQTCGSGLFVLKNQKPPPGTNTRCIYCDEPVRSGGHDWKVFDADGVEVINYAHDKCYRLEVDR